MSVGGIVDQVIISGETVYVEILDKGFRQWRALALTKRSRCIGIGDSLWWQNHVGYWTPKESHRIGPGSCDITVGRCTATTTPQGAASGR